MSVSSAAALNTTLDISGIAANVGAVDPVIAEIRELVKKRLAPKVLDVDLKAEYPEDLLRDIGKAGGYRGAASPEYGGNDLGLRHVVEVMEKVSKECLSTGFMIWCQTACARYIDKSDNAWVKERYLPRIVSGELLAGTGLSNTMKSADTIEDYRLSARRAEGGYVINGVLPWVSNLGPDHVFTTGCPVRGVDGEVEGLAFVLVECSQPGFRLVDCAHFIGLDGTRTLACQFKECFIPDAMVLAQPGESAAYLTRIKPGMILAQMGMGLGLIDGCALLMEQSNRTHGHVNQYLDDQVGDIAAALEAARTATYELCDAVETDADGGARYGIDVLKLRLAGGELSVRAAHAAMLHQGAKGYLVRNAAQRRLREAYFVAIVTPSTKHLRREIARMESASRAALACAA